MEPSYRDFLFDHETDVHLAYYSSIGRVMVNWSMLESQFDIALLMLFTSLGGNAVAAEPPVSMKRKLDFFGKCFKRLEPLSSKKGHALCFSNRMGEAARSRNIMLHTNWGNVMAPKKLGEVTGSGLRSNSEGYIHYNATMTLDRLHDMLLETSNLQAMLLPIEVDPSGETAWRLG